MGEQVANELVDWFNAVDASYKADLRELNEANWVRYEARLDQRLAEFAASIRVEIAAMDAKLERRLGEQTRWLFVAWATLMVAIVGFGLR